MALFVVCRPPDVRMLEELSRVPWALGKVNHVLYRLPCPEKSVSGHCLNCLVPAAFLCSGVHCDTANVAWIAVTLPLLHNLLRAPKAGKNLSVACCDLEMEKRQIRRLLLHGNCGHAEEGGRRKGQCQLFEVHRS